MAEEQQDAKVQASVTASQLDHIKTFARIYNVDPVELYQAAVREFLDSEPTSLEELGRQRAEMHADVNRFTQGVDGLVNKLVNRPNTEEIIFYLYQSERELLDDRARHENLSRAGAVERAIALYIAKLFDQHPELRYS